MNPRKLTKDQVFEIKDRVKAGASRASMAARFGVSPQLISSVVKYGYDGVRDKERERVRRTGDDCETWVEIARRYNQRWAHDQITPAQAKVIHDQALRKIRCMMEEGGLTMGDFV